HFASTANIAECDGSNNYVSGPKVNQQGSGQVFFDTHDLTCRSLTLDPVNGVVYMAYGDPGDGGPYNGWIVGYSASNLALKAEWCAAPNVGVSNGENGIWQAGGAIAVDAAGNQYVETGNGPNSSNRGFETFANTITSASVNLSSTSFTISVTTTADFA